MLTQYGLYDLSTMSWADLDKFEDPEKPFDYQMELCYIAFKLFPTMSKKHSEHVTIDFVSSL